MRADGLARTVADFRRFRILADGMRTVRLKSGAGKPQMKTGPERAEVFALPIWGPFNNLPACLTDRSTDSFSSPVSYFPSRNTTPDLISGDRFCNHRSGADDSAVSDLDAFKDYRIAANQHIVSDFNRGHQRLRIPHAARAQVVAVVVVGENTIRSDRAIISDLDPGLAVELYISGNKSVVADYNVGSGKPVTIKFEVGVRFDEASAADLDLMWPRHFTSWDSSTGADFGA